MSQKAVSSKKFLVEITRHENGESTLEIKTKGKLNDSDIRHLIQILDNYIG